MNFEQNLNDRKLGHEWYGWDGNIEAHEAFIREPKRLFLGMLFLGFGLIFGLACLLAWGVYPRLQSIHPLLGQTALGIVVAFGTVFGALYGILCYTLSSRGCNRLADAIGHHLFRLYTPVAVLSERFGISRDRLGYSLLEIHNDLTRNRLKKFSNGRILCLAPRCLDRENQEQIRSLVAEYDCDFYMAPTGAQARQRIVTAKPAAIIGIACERDLITGIRDVGYRIPVIGVTNKRPFGPCKGAFIDLNELREAIEVFKERFEVEPVEAVEPATAAPSRA